jgi:hypothetical protein
MAGLCDAVSHAGAEPQLPAAVYLDVNLPAI